LLSPLKHLLAILTVQKHIPSSKFSWMLFVGALLLSSGK
jgi:hypothetical protein